jgi:phosphoglycerate dehydrogenase-like enzyme
MDRPVAIFLTERSYRRHWDQVLAVAPLATAVTLQADGTTKGAMDAVEVVWATSDVMWDGLTRKFYGAVVHTPGIRWLQSPGAGFDAPFFARFAAGGGRITASHVNASPIAEYVVWAVLDHTMGAARWRAAAAGGEWAQGPHAEVRGQVWTIVGFGSIGRAIAAPARALGVTVRGVRRRPAADDPADELFPVERTLKALAGADAVILATPLGPDTANLADASFFDSMAKGSLLVNVGRGGLVDEAALLVGLERDHPGAAVLDVTVAEPLPPEHPFWRHPKITVTPHVSGTGARNDERLADLFVTNLSAYLRGDPLLWEVDPRTPGNG